MKVKLFDSELKIMEILWEAGDITAKEIAEFSPSLHMSIPFMIALIWG